MSYRSFLHSSFSINLWRAFMEYWDLYDKDRKPLGRTHLRGDGFGEGEYYVCCEIWVLNSEGKLLTTKRHPDKKAGNLWEFVGGGTLAGENTKQSAVRELFEETGIKAEEDRLILLATNASKNYFQDIYLLKADFPIGSVVLQPDEAIDAKWSSFEDINKMIANEEMVYTVGKRFEKYGADILGKAGTELSDEAIETIAGGIPTMIKNIGTCRKCGGHTIDGVCISCKNKK